MRRRRQRLQARVRFRRLPHREQHPDAVGQQPAGHEAEDVGRLLVQPLRVVDHAQHRPRPRPRPRAASARPGRPGTDRPAARSPARRPRPAPAAAARAAGPRRAGSGTSSWWTAAKPRLFSDSTATIRTICRSDGALDRVVEQRRLPHPGLPPKHQRPAHPGAHAVEHLVERLLLGAAVDQPHPTTVAPVAPRESEGRIPQWPCWARRWTFRTIRACHGGARRGALHDHAVRLDAGTRPVRPRPDAFGAEYLDLEREAQGMLMCE